MPQWPLVLWGIGAGSSNREKKERMSSFDVAKRSKRRTYCSLHNAVDTMTFVWKYLEMAGESANLHWTPASNASLWHNHSEIKWKEEKNQSQASSRKIQEILRPLKFTMAEDIPYLFCGKFERIQRLQQTSSSYQSSANTMCSFALNDLRNHPVTMSQVTS